MTAPARGLVDTSVLIAQESGRPIARELLPDAGAVSVITVGELQAGILSAADVDTRQRRLRTLKILEDMEVILVDEAVAAEWARLRLYLAEHRRRMNVNDLWIAATATSLGIPLVTQEADFDALEGARGVALIRV